MLLERQPLERAERHRGALLCSPTLAVEVVYLAAGTKTVWVLWPQRRQALAYHRDGSVQHVMAGQFLEAPEVLPGARVPIDEILLPGDQA